MAGRFEGKRGLVTGVANKRSIAWAIGRRLADEGAQLAFTYQGERIEKSVRELAESVSSPLITSCDVRADEDVDRVMREVGETFDAGLDLLVHSVAFAAAEDLEGRFTDTPRDRFWMALDVSAYSLVALARAAEPLMEAAGGGSILTMTYLGGQRAVPHYNVMGVAKSALDSSVQYLAWDLGQKNIRVNAISAGPVRTLAARSIAGFPTMEAIVVTPICPQGLAYRPIVLHPSSRIEVGVRATSGLVTLALDGQGFLPVRQGERVIVTRHPEPYPLLTWSGLDPYRRLRERLGWSGVTEPELASGDDDMRHSDAGHGGVL